MENGVSLTRSRMLQKDVEDESPTIKACDEVLRRIDVKLKQLDAAEQAERMRMFRDEAVSSSPTHSENVAIQSRNLLDELYTEPDASDRHMDFSIKLVKSKICEILAERASLQEDLLEKSKYKENLKSLSNQESMAHSGIEDMDIHDGTNHINNITLNNNIATMKSRNSNSLTKENNSIDESNTSEATRSLKLRSSIIHKPDLISVRDVALASTSTQYIEFIDAEEESSEIGENAKNSKTEKGLTKEVDGKLGVKDLLSSLTDSTNSSADSINLVSRAQMPHDAPNFRKSNLKRKLSTSLEAKKNKMKYLQFTNITIFYFERSQGFSSIPSKGGATLGMVNHHFYITTLPIDDYEHNKVPRYLPRTRSTNILSYQRIEKPKNMEALSSFQRAQLLESSHVIIEQTEEEDCNQIRTSRIAAGCDCKDYCDPDVCSCHLAEIQCQVDRPNFPCSCTKDHCRNATGRNEYNHFKVKSHFYKTMRRMKIEGKNKHSKRKSQSPSKVISRSDITFTEICCKVKV